MLLHTLQTHVIIHLLFYEEVVVVIEVIGVVVGRIHILFDLVDIKNKW